jgi:hypothetical protein
LLPLIFHSLSLTFDLVELRFNNPTLVAETGQPLQYWPTLCSYVVATNLRSAFHGWSRGAVMNAAITGALFALRLNFVTGYL